jgi:hypothetical protein
MSMRRVETIAEADSYRTAQHSEDALAADAALAACLRGLADQRAALLTRQLISRRAPSLGSVKLGPSSRARNSLGVAPVQRRNAR